MTTHRATLVRAAIVPAFHTAGHPAFHPAGHPAFHTAEWQEAKPSDFEYTDHRDAVVT